MVKNKEHNVSNLPYFGFQWHITDRCDQRCKHCYIYTDPQKNKVEEMDFSQMCKTLEYCVDFCKRFYFRPWFFITGGDPLLHGCFWQFAQKLKDGNYPFTIMGNPYHLTEEACKHLCELGCKQYQMSIDGLRQTHDSIRRKGSFDETLKKISHLRRVGIVASIMTTVSALNIHEIPDIMETVAEHDASSYAFSRYCAVEKDNNEVDITPEQYRRLFDVYAKKALELSKRGYKTMFGKKDHLWSLYEYELLGMDFPNVIKSVNINDGCGCGIRHLTILPSGEIWACRRIHNSKVGSVWDQDIDDMWLNRMDYYRHYEKFEKCSKCELFSICRGCPSVAYASSKNFYGIDPQCWKKIV